MNPRGKTRKEQSCPRCGRRVFYLWAIGGGRGCHGCASKAGVRTIYPGNRVLRLKGQEPIQEGE